MATPFVPEAWEAPLGLSTPLFELSVLHPKVAEQDFDAVMTSRSGRALLTVP